MAKSKSILGLQGTFQGMTFVDSVAYGKHMRAARGTNKPAVVNEAFRQESARLQDANVPAKMVRDALDPYRHYFKGGFLWQRLVSEFRKQLHAFGAVDFGRMEPVEVHEKYTLSRFLNVYPKVVYDSTTRMLQVTLDYGHHPNLKKMSYLDGYRIGVIGIFPDLSRKLALTTVNYTDVMSFKQAYVPPVLDLVVPADATSYLLCVVAEGAEQGKICDYANCKGMKIVVGGAFRNS